MDKDQKQTNSNTDNVSPQKADDKVRDERLKRPRGRTFQRTGQEVKK